VETERINAEDFAKSLNGFEELAIRKAFGVGISELEGTMVPRAILFINEKRNGLKDFDAYNSAMLLTLSAIEGRFEVAPDTGKVQTT
jgi:hypothetical protein